MKESLFQHRQNLLLQIGLVSFYALVFSTTLEASVIPVSHSTSIMKVVIEGEELYGNFVSNKEYRINDRYVLSPSFVNGDFKKIVNKIENILRRVSIIKREPASNNSRHVKKHYDDHYKDNGTVLLEYVTVGNGKKMITNVAVADLN
jgi:hypothetical protein